MLSPMSRAALVSSFTGGTESSEDVARAVTTVTTPAVATAAMARGPAKPARVPVKSVAAICAALMPAATAVRTPSRPPNVTVPAAMPRTRPGFSSTTPCIQPRTSAPTSYKSDITGVKSSPMAIFRPSAADCISVSLPFMLSSMVPAILSADPAQSFRAAV